MKKNVFDYLENDYEYLNSYIVEINKNLFITPYTSIVKGRLFAEKLSQEISKLEGLGSLEELTQVDRLRKLKIEDDISNEVYNLFHTIRRIGNSAVHEGVEGELSEALNIHRCIYKLTGWFVEVYLDHNFVLPPYKEPKQKSDLDAGIVKSLFSKFNKVIDSINNKNDKNYIEEVVNNVTIYKPKEETFKKESLENVNIKDEEIINGRNRICLIDELSRLKQSSKEAVEGLNKFSDFKKYMHVERDVQRKLEDLIIKSSESDKSQLILVCGSVGDGKSHIISYFKNKYPDVISNFKLHNDATESLEPNKTSMDTLNSVLDDFSDEKIEKSKSKLILAINLGTLNNFIDSKYKERFSKLKEFVEENKILEQTIVDNNFDENNNIQYVNFCDYHPYTLKDGKAKSEYIKKLIGKLVDKSELNCFYISYKENCTKCINNSKCPIKANYELLSNEKVQDSIIELIIQVIIKNKTIISTRSLLNFLHDMLISRTYIDINSPTFKQKINTLKNEDYIKSLMPNILFSYKKLSIFEGLNKIDPLKIRNEEVDDFIIKFNNSVDLIDLFNEYIDYPKGYLGPIEELDVTDKQVINKIKLDLLKLFIRSYLLCGKNNLFSLNENIYDEFIENLYYWNKGEKAKLKNLYSFIKDGIFKWNGSSDKNNINIFIGKNQTKYKISEEIEFKADLSRLPSNSNNELIKFLNTMKIEFKSDSLNKTESIEVDYLLYKLLKKVTTGYRPNKKDKNQFVKFVEFINKLECAGSQNESLLFTEKNREDNKKYKLEYDDEFEIYRFVVS